MSEAIAIKSHPYDCLNMNQTSTTTIDMLKWKESYISSSIDKEQQATKEN